MSTSSPDIDYGSLAALDEGPFHDLNAQFVLNSGYLVFFMHCGFAMVSTSYPTYQRGWSSLCRFPKILNPESPV